MENSKARKEGLASVENNSKTIEVSAKTVAGAIAKGIEQLGVPRDDVAVEIIEEGSRGVLGLGATDAVVRLIYTAPPMVIAKQPPARQEIVSLDEHEEPSTAASSEESEHAVADEEATAREVLAKLLQYMGLEATAIQRQANLPPSLIEEGGEIPLVLDIIGADLGTLLGHRGETLNALQYITRLIVSHQLKRRTNLIVDVESYRAKREKSLRQLAQRMAERALREGRTIRLEPMPAYERRIVHLALHDDETVYTESEGEGHNRRVTIVPA